MKHKPTPKQRVLAKYPKAICCCEWDNFWRVTVVRKYFKECVIDSIGVDWTPRKAWLDAAKKVDSLAL